MQRNDLLSEIEKDYNDKVKEMKYLSKGDNGYVSRVTFVSEKMLCIKSILLTNSSAEKDFRITKIMYGDKFDVKSYRDYRFLYFTIPFFPGKDLDAVIKSDKPLNICMRLRIFMKLIAGVNKMHEKGILHRDLKAPNVIVNITENNLDVNIIDFGRSVCIYDAKGKPIATPEDLSLRNTVSHSHSFFHPLWQFVRKFQTQTAPEYTALTSHWYGYAYEGESVGLRSDYYSLATLFQRLVPEHARIAAPVIYSEGFHRNDAYHSFIESASNLLARYEKLYGEFDAYVVMSPQAKNALGSLHI